MKLTLTAAILMMTCEVQAVAAVSATDNFTATHRDTAFAHQVTAAAEKARSDYAVIWLGKEIPRWNERCPIAIKITNGGGGGATTMTHDRGEVYGWSMRVQGNQSAILNDVVPHEVTHTVLHSHFKRKVPRWADEGMATLSETPKEYNDQWIALRQTWNTRPMSARQVFVTKEYPRDTNATMSFYARGFYMTAFLVEQRDRKEFLLFLDTAHRQGWDKALAVHYGYSTVERMDQDWRGWVAQKPVVQTVKQFRREKTHVLAFGYPGCPPCDRHKRDEAAGMFPDIEFEYVNVKTPEGWERFVKLGAAIEKATAGSPRPFKFRQRVPAFHRKGEAVIVYDYGAGDDKRLLGWLMETIRIPLTLTEGLLGLIYPNADGGEDIPAPENSTPFEEPSVDVTPPVAAPTPNEPVPPKDLPDDDPVDAPEPEDDSFIIVLLAAGMGLVETFLRKKVKA